MNIKEIWSAAGRFYTRLHLLSLDIVMGALAGASLAARISGTEPGWAFWVVLAASVWLVYTTDHFLDGIKSGKMAWNPRHLFHFRHAGPIAWTIVLTGILTAMIAFTFLPKKLIHFGIVLGGIVLVYLLLAYLSDRFKHPHLHKEYIIAIVYIAGIWAGPLLLSEKPAAFAILILIAVNFLMALINLLTLSYYDYETDIHDGDISFAVVNGKTFTSFTIYILVALSISASGMVLLLYPKPLLIASAIIFIIMSAVQFIIFRFSNYFLPHNRFRIYGELVFLMPAFIMLIPS